MQLQGEVLGKHIGGAATWGERIYSSTSSVVALASSAITSGDVSALSVGVIVLVPGSGPSVHVHSRTLFRRPATGVSGHLSLSDSSEEESRFSPT